MTPDRPAARPNWPKVRARQAALSNALVAKLPSIRAAHADLELRPVALPHAIRAVTRIDLAIDGQEASAYFDRDILAELSGLPVSAAELETLPDALRLPVVEAGLDALLEPHLAKLGLAIEVRALGGAAPDSCDTDGRVSLGWRGYDREDRERLACVLKLADQLVPPLLDLAERAPAVAGSRVDAHALSVFARLELGRTSLTLAELRDLGRDDVVLVERHAWDRSLAVLDIAGYQRVPVRVEPEALVVVDGENNDPMTDDEPIEREAPAAASVEELTLPLTVDLGRIELTVGEIAQIAVGSTLDLGKALDAAVELRVNGRLIGRGELVDLEGRFGVRVTRIFPRDDG